MEQGTEASSNTSNNLQQVDAPKSAALFTAWLRRSFSDKDRQPKILDGSVETAAPDALLASKQKIGNRLGGFFGGVMYSATGAWREAGSRSFQKSPISNKLLDFSDAVKRLEISAQSLGPARVACLRRWTALLEKPQVSSAISLSGVEGEWQHVSTDVAEANELLFVKSNATSSQDPLTFMEVLLDSHALEILVSGFIEVPPTSEEERLLLLQLLNTCLNAPSTVVSIVLDQLTQIATSRERCRSTLMVGNERLVDILADAVTQLKKKPHIQTLNRRMATLTHEIGAKAALSAQLYKFSQTEYCPTSELGPQTVAAGLAATCEVVDIAAVLQNVAAESVSLVQPPETSFFVEAVDLLKAQSSQLAAQITTLLGKIEETQKHREEGRAFRGRKLQRMQSELQAVANKIVDLEQHRARLLAELDQVEQELTQARMQKSDIEEGTSVFEEGYSMALEATEATEQELTVLQQEKVAQTAAMQASQALLLAALEGCQATAERDKQVAEDMQKQAELAYLHAACRHCYYQRAQLQILLAQLRFCASELKGMQKRELHMSEIGIGMHSIMHDARGTHRRLSQRYLEAEAALLGHLDQLDAMRSSFVLPKASQPSSPASPASAGASPLLRRKSRSRSAKGGAVGLAWSPVRAEPQLLEEEGNAEVLQPAASTSSDEPKGVVTHIKLQGDPIPMSPELQELLEHIDVLAGEFRKLKRPPDLPPPGTVLPDLEAEEQVPVQHVEVTPAMRSMSVRLAPSGRRGSAIAMPAFELRTLHTAASLPMDAARCGSPGTSPAQPSTESTPNETVKAFAAAIPDATTSTHSIGNTGQSQDEPGTSDVGIPPGHRDTPFPQQDATPSSSVEEQEHDLKEDVYIEALHPSADLGHWTAAKPYPEPPSVK